jgi:signal transduction histidine kinase
MEALVESFDWRSTPLGDPSEWPQSLRTAVHILVTSRFAMWLGWGPELSFLYNDAYRHMTLGKKHPWALGRPTRDVWPEIWPDIEPRIRFVMEQGEATWDEALPLILERSGYAEETYHTFSYSPLTDDSGRVVGMLCVVAEETDRVIGERRLSSLRELSTELARANEERAVHEAVERALGANLRDLPFTLLYLFDDEGNAKLCARTGLSADHPLAIEWIEAGARSPWPMETRTRVVVDDLRNRFPGGSALPNGAWDRPPEVAAVVPIAQQGQEKPAGFLIAGLNPYRHVDAAYGGYLDLLGGQIASRLANARAYEAERRRAEALAELDRAKTAFFSNVSHEFRTPLTLILAPIEDALADPALDTRNRERIVVAHRNALRLLKLVNTLLDFSRIEAGRVDAVYEPTDFSAYTAELASNFRSAVERSGLELVVDAPALNEPVYIDRDMWEKVVLNLLSNAFKHTFEGSITVRVKRERGNAVMSVSDTGVGIPADQLSHIFERFHRVPNTRSRTQEGTGIGLALVSELVRLHGGAVSVESEEGRGTTFTVSMPLGSAHLPAGRIGTERERASTALGAAPYVEEAMRWLPAAESDKADGATEQETKRGRVIVAEDNADMRDYIVRLLREAGLDVEAVGDGATALERVRTNPPDLVVSDVMMPRMDGFELLSRIRSDSRIHSTPVILLSARAGEEARIEGMQAGADDYLVKPFAARELLARVDTQIRRGEVLDVIETERARLRDLLVQAPAAIAVLRGPDHVYSLANERYMELVAHRPVVGRPIREALPELGGQILADGLDVFGILDRVYATGVPYLGESARVMLANHRDGNLEEHYFTFIYAPVHEGNAIAGVFVHAVDVTVQVQAQRAAEEANRSKSEFLAAMSHELRTPLNAIAGHAQLMEMGVHGPLTDQQREALRRISRSESHLLALINDVLNFAKLEAGRVEYDIRDVPLARTVADVVSMVDLQLKAKQLECSVDIANDPIVRADDEKVRQILINLLSNAIKFTDPGGKITVDTPPPSEPGLIALRIADTGIGIASEKHDAIFDPFVQVQRNLTRPVEGTGLGLAISRDLARGMKGDLTVKSAPGEGAAFTLTLPNAAS